MKHIIKLFSLSVFILLIGSFSNNAVAQSAFPIDLDHTPGYECLEPPLGTMTTKDCFTQFVPDEDLAHFCLYGHKASNVYITPPKKGLPSTTIYCTALGCTAEMTTYDKFQKGDQRIGLPNNKSRPHPTAPDPITCVAGIGGCAPKFCPCTNYGVVALWRSICLGRQQGGKG